MLKKLENTVMIVIATNNDTQIELNIWYISSICVSLFVAIPIITVFSSFFSTTSDYLILLKATFLRDYVINSAIILIGVLFLTFLFGVL